MIRIKRDSGYTDRFRAYKIVLDEKVIGEIKNGEQREFDVQEGKHKVQLKIDWCTSNSIDFEYSDRPIELECGSTLRGWRIIMALIYTTFLRDKYIWLKKKNG